MSAQSFNFSVVATHVAVIARAAAFCTLLLTGCGSDERTPIGLRPLAPPEVSLEERDVIGLQVTLTRDPGLDESITVQVGGAETCDALEEPTEECIISANPYPLVFTSTTGARQVVTIRGLTQTDNVYLSVPVQIVDVVPDEDWEQSGAILSRTWRVRVTD